MYKNEWHGSTSSHYLEMKPNTSCIQMLSACAFEVSAVVIRRWNHCRVLSMSHLLTWRRYSLAIPQPPSKWLLNCIGVIFAEQSIHSSLYTVYGPYSEEQVYYLTSGTSILLYIFEYFCFIRLKGKTEKRNAESSSDQWCTVTLQSIFFW